MQRRNFIKYGLGASAGLHLSFGHFPHLAQLIHENKRGERVYIIGSGYGGSVAALRLAQAGIPSTLIEMGIDWNKHQIAFSSLLNPGKSAAWLQNTSIAPFMNVFPLKKFTGALDRVSFDNVDIWVGRGFGGGSIVNGGMAVLPKKDYFREIFPSLDADSFYAQYFPLAQRELKVNEVPQVLFENSRYYQFARNGVREARLAGFETVMVPNVYDFDYMQREERNEVPKSALHGEVIYGNNHGKNSLDKTYLKKALATGLVDVLELHQVETIEELQTGTYRIAAHVLNTSGERIEEKSIIATSVFLCAGSLGTTEILLRSQAKGLLPQTNSEFGKHWGNNGNVMAGRNFVKGSTGVKQSTIPIAGIDHWNDHKHPFFAEISPLPINMEVWTALYLVINKLNGLGNLTYNAKTNLVQLNWGPTETQKMKDNTRYFIKRMNRANGGTPAHLFFKNGVSEKICYHPLGGCVLGLATDLHGRVKASSNLYVLDGSLIPGTVGVNPFLTITALSEYCIENIIKRDFLT